MNAIVSDFCNLIVQCDTINRSYRKTKTVVGRIIESNNIFSNEKLKYRSISSNLTAMSEMFQVRCNARSQCMI